MVIGFIAGVLAARVFHVPGFGVLGDVALGLAGALISAISALLAGVGHGVITSIVVGGHPLLGLRHRVLITRRTPRRRRWC
jgi:uncharacterized membrane protein YeaQ/YmgE (transglycosylase-associated protein family)